MQHTCPPDGLSPNSTRLPFSSLLAARPPGRPRPWPTMTITMINMGPRPARLLDVRIHLSFMNILLFSGGRAGPRTQVQESLQSGLSAPFPKARGLAWLGAPEA